VPPVPPSPRTTVEPELDPELDPAALPSAPGVTPLDPPVLASSSVAPELPPAPLDDEDEEDEDDDDPAGPSVPSEPTDELQWKDEDAMAASAIADRTRCFFMITPDAGMIHFIAVLRWGTSALSSSTERVRLLSRNADAL
jgi:hypothetical protein